MIIMNEEIIKHRDRKIIQFYVGGLNAREFKIPPSEMRSIFFTGVIEWMQRRKNWVESCMRSHLFDIEHVDLVRNIVTTTDGKKHTALFLAVCNNDVSRDVSVVYSFLSTREMTCNSTGKIIPVKSLTKIDETTLRTIYDEKERKILPEPFSKERKTSIDIKLDRILEKLEKFETETIVQVVQENE